MDYVERLKAARGKLSQAKAAIALGIPVRTWEDWERGIREPPEYVVNLIEAEAKKGALMKKLAMKETLTKEAYAALTAEERRHVMKVEQAKECSGWRNYPSTCEAIFEQIPSEWWDKYSAEHIGEVAAMLKVAYDNGKNA